MKPITAWAEDDRPREKLLLKGRHTLSDSELLAILIGSGSRRKSAVELAREILDLHNNDYNKLGKTSVAELMKIKGIGKAKAVQINAAMEISNRRKSSSPEMEIIRSSRDCFNFIKKVYADKVAEEFHVVFLNRANKILGSECMSKGGMSGTIADGKLIFRKALEYRCSAMILSHNHPSGQLKPSEADRKLTRSLIDFGKLIDIQILDHIIVAENNYFSFADEGIMN